MGGCAISTKTNTKVESIVRATNRDTQQLNNREYTTINANNMPSQRRTTNPQEKFKDFEEIEGESIGEGIKRINAYKSDMLFDEIDRLREEFYKFQTQRRDLWTTIRLACEADAATAEILIAESGLVCLNNNMRCVVETHSGFVLNVPNFCINYPLVKREEKKEINQELIEEKNIKITMIDVFNGSKTFTITVSNHLFGKDLKILFLQKEEKSEKDFKIRLLFSGQEIHDDDPLSKFRFNLAGNNKVQVSCTKIEE